MAIHEYDFSNGMAVLQGESPTLNPSTGIYDEYGALEATTLEFEPDSFALGDEFSIALVMNGMLCTESYADGEANYSDFVTCRVVEFSDENDYIAFPGGDDQNAIMTGVKRVMVRWDGQSYYSINIGDFNNKMWNTILINISTNPRNPDQYRMVLQHRHGTVNLNFDSGDETFGFINKVFPRPTEWTKLAYMKINTDGFIAYEDLPQPEELAQCGPNSLMEINFIDTVQPVAGKGYEMTLSDAISTPSVYGNFGGVGKGRTLISPKSAPNSRKNFGIVGVLSESFSYGIVVAGNPNMSGVNHDAEGDFSAVTFTTPASQDLLNSSLRDPFGIIFGGWVDNIADYSVIKFGNDDIVAIPNTASIEGLNNREWNTYLVEHRGYNITVTTKYGSVTSRLTDVLDLPLGIQGLMDTRQALDARIAYFIAHTDSESPSTPALRYEDLPQPEDLPQCSDDLGLYVTNDDPNGVIRSVSYSDGVNFNEANDVWVKEDGTYRKIWSKE